MKMIHKIINFIKIVLFFTILISCSKKEQIQDAISIFPDLNIIQLDDSLKEKSIKLPQQQENDSWTGRSNIANLLNIENFSFSDKINDSDSSIYSYKFLGKNHRASPPIIHKNTAYLIDHKGRITSFDLKNNKKNWQIKPFKTKFKNGKIYLNNGKLFATSGYNYLAAIDIEKESVLWSKKINSLIISAPIASKEQVLAITSDNKTYAFNANNGNINWIHEAIDKNTAILGASDPVFYKNHVFSSYSSGEIYVLNQKNGEIGWFYNLNINKAINSDFILNDIDNVPIIKDDIIYAVGNGGLMMAIKINNGAVLWKSKIASISDFWIVNDFIYLIDSDNNLLCLDRKFGKVKWHAQLDKNIDDKITYHGLIMAGDNLILSNSNKEILLISPKNGEILQRKKFWNNFYHSPTIANKKIYFNILGKFTNKLLILE